MGALIVEKYFDSSNSSNSFRVISLEKKMISDYTGLNFKELDDIAFFEYRLYRRDAWIYKQMESEEGKEFLHELYTLQESNADVQAIRDFNKGR